MKNLVDRIIQDLGEDKPIKGILLKAQIVASKLNNNDFKTWIENEQNGYPDASNLPDYRVLNAIVKADLSIPFSGYVRNYTIPAKEFMMIPLLKNVYVRFALHIHSKKSKLYTKTKKAVTFPQIYQQWHIPK